MTAPALPLPIFSNMPSPAKDWAKESRDARDTKPVREKQGTDDISQSLAQEEDNKVDDSAYFANMMQFFTQSPVANQSFDISLGGVSAGEGLYVDLPAPVAAAVPEKSPLHSAKITNANPLANPESGTASFSDAILSAFTLGTPDLPVTDVLANVAVPIPQVMPTTEKANINIPTSVAMNSDATLAVLKDAPASDPRLIVCGFSPLNMSKFKPLVSPTTNAVTTEQPVIVVVKAAPETAQPVAPTTVPAAAQQLAQTVAAQDKNSSAMPLVSTDSDLPSLMGTQIDPVELRIAQSFTGKPAAHNGTSSSMPNQPASLAANANTQNSGGFSFLNAQASNNSVLEATPRPNIDVSSIASLVTDDAVIAPTLTANPLLLPTGTINPLTSSIVQNSSAIASNPVVHSVAQVINHNAKNDGPKDFVIQLDPPELGRLQVKMKYQKGDPLKVHIVLEKADTVAMFQRDALGLEGALKNAGLELDMASLSFELAQDGSAFQEAMGGREDGKSGTQQTGRKTVSMADTLSIVESSVDIYTDKITGLTRYNLKV